MNLLSEFKYHHYTIANTLLKLSILDSIFNWFKFCTTEDETKVYSVLRYTNYLTILSSFLFFFLEREREE